jgi:DNA mismatch endonuclease (patch repair protein)
MAYGTPFSKECGKLTWQARYVFTSARIAVFCDGDFWHGRNWGSLRPKLAQGTNAAYWSAKIASNIKRDERNTALLEKGGWLVIRLWETDIKRDPAAAANCIRRVVNARQIKPNEKVRIQDEILRSL